MKEKIAFVVQRYGLEVNGGAELHCRQLAEKLSQYYDIEILTTCALDYMNWKNYYDEGVEDINGITVRRFKVDKERNIKTFNKLSEQVLNNPNGDYDNNIQWMNEQGPVCHGLIKYLDENEEKYKKVIFMTYLYWTTFFAMQKHNSKSILIPTAHDEPPIYLNIFKEFFKKPKYIAFNTVDEQNFVHELFKNDDIPSDIFGVGVDIPENLPEIDIHKKFNFDGEYLLYIGRIDESKGCKELFDYFTRYIKETGSDLKLVLMGKQVMNIPKHKNIISLGFVSDEEKFNGIKQAKLVVVPSKFESLSMVVLESLKLNKPVVVNGKCSVLRTHCILSNAGLYYENYYEFKEAVEFMNKHNDVYKIMKDNGSKYVCSSYDWQLIIDKFRDIIKW